MGARPLDCLVRVRRKIDGGAGARTRTAGAAEGTDGVPTGVAIRDPRGQLFEAAERVRLRDGPGGLASRAVPAGGGGAKGAVPRQVAEFDAFLVDLTPARISRITDQAAGLRAAAGTGTVA